MEINAIVGKSHVLNLDTVFNILKNRDKTKRHIIIAPDRSLFSLEQKLFEKTGESCFFDVDIISLTRLSKKILNGQNDKKVLTKQSGVALVKKLLIENQEKLKIFKKSISHIGFAENLFETICLYKSCNIAPADMYVDNSLNLSNLKQVDIKLIYSLYEEYLQSEYTDSFNQLKLFAKSIDKKTFPNTCFYFVEFEDFTSIMYDIIIKICKCSDKTYIACTNGKKNNNSNIYSNKVYLDLIDIFKSNGLDFKIINSDEFKSPEKNILCNNLFAYNLQKTDIKHNISINSFNNIIDEIKYTIADIYSLCINNKCNYSQIALVLPSILEYKNKLTLELEKYNIPYYFDESGVLSSHILIRTLFSVFDIINKNYSLADFTNLIKTDLFGFDYGNICTYENYLKKIGALPYECLNIKDLEIGEIKTFIEIIKSFETQLVNAKTNNDYVNIADSIFKYLVNTSQDYFNNLSALNQRVYTQVINKFQGIIKDFSEVFGNLYQENFDDFIMTFKSYFESMSISLPPISSNTLFIADINSSYLTTTDYIYVLGCNEGKLPKYSLDNGLVTDEEIAKLPNAKKINPTIKMLNARKLFKLFEVCLKYNNKLILSYNLSSSEGSLYPNTLIGNIKSLFQINENFASNVLDVVDKSFYKMDYDNIIFNNLNDKIVLDNLLDYIKNWDIYKDNQNYRKLVSTLYASNQTPYVSKLIANNNIKLNIANISNAKFFNNDKTSVSQIESFYSCPYKHYIRYGLRLRESVDADIKPNDIGTIIHEVLKDTLPFIINNKDKEDDILNLAKSNLDKVLSSEDNKSLCQNIDNKYIIKSLYNELERICKALINYVTYSNFTPKYYEYRFNSGDFKISNITITGAIDRVDVNDKDFLIIDYKTGSNDFSNYNDVLSGKKLQLLVYAKIFGDKTKLNPAGIFYLPLSNAFNKDESKNSYTLSGVMLKDDAVIRNIDTRLVEGNISSDIVSLKTTKDGIIYNTNTYKYMCLDGEDFNYLLDFAINQVKLAIDRISSGEINPNPLKDSGFSACTYCDYKGICNYLGDNDKEVVSIQSIEELKNTGDKDGGI